MPVKRVLNSNIYISMVFNKSLNSPVLISIIRLSKVSSLGLIRSLKMKKIIKMSIILTLATQVSATEILIAPPPMGYSPLKEVGSKFSARANYINYELDNSSSTGFGVGVAYRLRNTEESFHNFAFDYLYMDTSMEGSSNTGETSAFNFGYQYGHHIVAGLLGFVGANINYTAFASEVPNGSQSGADIYADTLIYAGTGGVQYEYDVSFGTLIPWVALSYVVGGSTDTETYTYGPTGTSRTGSTDVDAFGAYQFGFDIYFNAIYTSLSSMYQSTSDGSLLSLSLSYNF